MAKARFFSVGELRNRRAERDLQARAAFNAKRRETTKVVRTPDSGVGGSKASVATISVFVSSTFRDFRTERDLLAGPINERLNERLAPLGCRVQFVDLRWGVDTEGLSDADRERRVLGVCLGEIERCAPFFVGLIGSRAGTLQTVEQLRAATVGTVMPPPEAPSSVTALEIGYHALAGANRALFFRRQLSGRAPSRWVDSDPTALMNIISALPPERTHSYDAVTDGERLTDVGEFESLVLRELGGSIEAYVRALHDSRTHDVDELARAFFFEAHAEGFTDPVGQGAHLATLLRAGTSVCLLGPSGSGKSSLWCDVLTRLNSEFSRTTSHSVGVVAEDGGHDTVVRSLMYGLGYEAPAMPELRWSERTLMRTLDRIRFVEPPNAIRGAELLGAWTDLMAAAGRCLVAVDGLDRMNGGPARERLDLLTGLPPNATALITTADQRDARRLADRGFAVIELRAQAPEVAAEIAVAIAKAHHRQLPRKVADALVPEPRTPLWLRLAVDELMAMAGDVFDESELAGAHDPYAVLERVASSLPPSERDQVTRTAQRVERRLGEALARRYLSLHVVARFGLTPQQTQQIGGFSDLQLAELRRATSPLMIERDRDGRLMFRNRVTSAAIAYHVSEFAEQSRRDIVAALEKVRPQSDVLLLELLYQGVSDPDLAASVLPSLFPRFVPTYELTRRAERLIAELLCSEETRAAVLAGLSAAIKSEDEMSRRLGVRLHRRLIADRPTGRDLVGLVLNEASVLAIPEVDAALTDLALSDGEAQSGGQPGDMGTRRQIAGAIREAEKGNVTTARREMTSALQALRRAANNTRYPGLVIDLADGLTAGAHFEEDHGDTETARRLFDEALKAADALPDRDPAHEGVLARLRALAGIARCAASQGDKPARDAAYHRSRALAGVALDEWESGERMRQGLHVQRYGRFRMSVERLQDSEADTLAELREWFTLSAAELLKVSLRAGTASADDSSRFVQTARAAHQAEPDESNAEDRLKALETVAIAFERASEWVLADDCWEVFAEGLRLAAGDNTDGWLAYGLARRSLLAHRTKGGENARKLCIEAQQVVKQVGLLAAPLVSVEWTLRAMGLIWGDDQSDRAGLEATVARWCSELCQIPSDDTNRLDLVRRSLTGDAGRDNAWLSAHASMALACIRTAISSSGS